MDGIENLLRMESAFVIVVARLLFDGYTDALPAKPSCFCTIEREND